MIALVCDRCKAPLPATETAFVEMGLRTITDLRDRMSEIRIHSKLINLDLCTKCASLLGTAIRTEFFEGKGERS